ncbi:hypothetical protein EEB19_18255 [Gordonia sp. OPL2]|nr:hypothetical protein EEB19_18255 [Gordonia sp. OPL2]
MVGGIVVVLIVLVGVGVFLTRDSVTDSDDVAVGDCVTVSGTQSDDNISAKKADCTSQSTFTFFVAQKASGATCPSDDYSRLYWMRGGEETGEQLCLVPNLVQGECYQIPTGGLPTASLSDYKKVSCGATKAAGTEVLRVEQRTPTPPSCSSGQLEVFFQLPKPIGYCLSDPSA